MTTKKQTETTIEIPKVEIAMVKFRVRGITPLIVSRFNEKAAEVWKKIEKI